MTKMTMNINELAETLGISVQAVYNRRSTEPNTIPEPLEIPGQRTLVWLRDDVHKWLVRFSPNKEVPEKPATRPRGRPRKNP